MATIWISRLNPIHTCFYSTITLNVVEVLLMSGQDDLRTTLTVASINVKHFHCIILQKLGINVVLYNYFVTKNAQRCYFYWFAKEDW